MRSASNSQFLKDWSGTFKEQNDSLPAQFRYSQLKALFVFLRAEGLNLVCTLFCWLFIIKSMVEGSSVKQNAYLLLLIFLEA